MAWGVPIDILCSGKPHTSHNLEGRTRGVRAGDCNLTGTVVLAGFLERQFTEGGLGHVKKENL